MIDRDILKKYGWSEQLIDAATNVAESVQDINVSVPGSVVDFTATTGTVAGSSLSFHLQDGSVPSSKVSVR